MNNDCKTCPVSTGTHKPAEALHQQIDEPQSEALRLAAWLLHRGMSGIKQNDIEASNQLRWLHAESLQHKQELAAYRFTVANRDARIAELEAQLEAIGAGGVEPLRKQAAQAVHQIAEPAAPVGKPIKDAIDALVMAAFTEGGCSEHRMSEARIQTELRKKELCTLLSTPQPCSRSHPHEEMTPMCELRTEIARLTNALARAEAAAPQAVQPAVQEGWQLVPIEPTREMLDAYVAADGRFHSGRTDWAVMLAAAPAHPAEGVPEQAAPGMTAERASYFMRRFLKEEKLLGPNEQAAMHYVISLLAATQPAAQGMEARDEAFEAVRKAFCKLQRYSFFLDSRNNVRRCADHCGNWVEFEAVHTLFEPQSVDAALAAQAKQGG